MMHASVQVVLVAQLVIRYLKFRRCAMFSRLALSVFHLSNPDASTRQCPIQYS